MKLSTHESMRLNGNGPCHSANLENPPSTNHSFEGVHRQRCLRFCTQSVSRTSAPLGISSSTSVLTVSEVI